MPFLSLETMTLEAVIGTRPSWVTFLQGAAYLHGPRVARMDFRFSSAKEAHAVLRAL